MAKDQGPWGQNDNGSPWGDMDKSPRKAKVIDLPKLKNPAILTSASNGLF